MPNNVTFSNNAGFATSFSIQWNGGQTGRTQVTMRGQTIEMDLTRLNIPAGTSCWARAYVIGGPNHDSGDNFTFNPGDSSTAIYTISGTTLDPSFSLSVTPSAVFAAGLAAAGAAGTHKNLMAADDVTGFRYVKFLDRGAFSANFSVQWNGGETYRTEVVNGGQDTDTVDLAIYTPQALPPQTSCWARVYVMGGVNHDSGRNFTYDPTSNATVAYTVTGGSLTPSFD